jgi:hypothetical protein
MSDQKKVIEKAETQEFWDLEEKLKNLQHQYIDIISPEEANAEKGFQEKSNLVELMQEDLKKLVIERNAARGRWEDAKKKTQEFIKQIHSVRNELNKYRKKLGLPLLEEPGSEAPKNSEFKVFTGLNVNSPTSEAEENPPRSETEENPPRSEADESVSKA